GHVRVRLELEPSAERCVLTVSDDGIGIAPEMRPRIFQMFAQVDTALDRANGGMGVGLALVKRLVELHGGSIDVTSAGVGFGSEFSVTLPRPAETSAREALVRAAAPDSAAGVRVVVVDDNEDMRELTRELLESLGCVVDTAADGREGLDRILDVRPTLALVDIGLPLLSGFELAEAVRAELGHGPYLVAVTGYGQAQDRSRSLSSGFDQHLTKPVPAAKLGELVAAARAAAQTRSA
ncbi:MAG TPA: ATP-binding protein, partial [Kofleriaceae bacterium]